MTLWTRKTNIFGFPTLEYTRIHQASPGPESSSGWNRAKTRDEYGKNTGRKNENSKKMTL